MDPILLSDEWVDVGSTDTWDWGGVSCRGNRSGRLMNSSSSSSISIINRTRMHSSRMRTVRCSSRRWGGVELCPSACWDTCLGVYAPVHAGIPAWGVSIPVHAGIPAQGVSAPVHAGIHIPSAMDRILDRRLWKHYLSATTVADGNGD